MAEADFRTCSICIEQFKDPKILPCFHTFCLRCLQQYVATSVQEGVFPCPVCRFEVTLPEGGVGGFQTNFYIEADAERRAFSPSVVCDVCSSCADRKCRECSQNLCKTCTAIHNSLASSRAHTTIVLGESDEKTAIISRAQFCSKHKGEVIRFHCSPCDKPICRDCKLTSHEGHKTEDLCDLVAGAKSSLAKTKVDFEQCIETVDTNLRIIDTRKSSLENTRVKTCSDIKKSADDLITLIKEYCTREMKTIDAIAKAEEKSLDSTKSELTLNKRCLQAQIDHVDTMLFTGLDADVMITASEIKKVLEDVKCTKEASLIKTETSEHAFVQKISNRQWMWNVFANTNLAIVSIVVTSEAAQLRNISTFNCLSQPIDVIGPLSDTSTTRAWVGCASKGCQNNVLVLVDGSGKIFKKASVQTDRYSNSRHFGLQYVLHSATLSDATKAGCEKCDTNMQILKKSDKNVSKSDQPNSTPEVYTFCGKNNPTSDKNGNGDICRVDVVKRMVKICLSNGSEMTITLDSIPEYKDRFMPRDVCWGLKNDIFIADCGLNVVHRYELSQGFKQCFITGQPLFSPTAVAMDSKGNLWIGEINGRISICCVYQ